MPQQMVKQRDKKSHGIWNDFWTDFGAILGGFWEPKSVIFGIDFLLIFTCRSKSGPRAAQSGPRAAKSRPRAPKSAPRAAQERPRAAQERPGAAQERPKAAQERPRAV